MSELKHHGIKGQKWGIRRYQNPDGTLTNAGRKRLADNVRKHMIKDQNYDSESRLAKSNATIKKAINSSSLKSARSELDKLGELVRGYADNEDVIYKYKVKACAQMFGESEEAVREQHGKDDVWLMYEDWDQGYPGDSFDLYLRDNGTDTEKFNNTKIEALRKYREECKKVAETLLGEYGDTPVKRRYSWEGTTAKDAVTDAMVQIAENERLLYYG